MTTPRFTLAQTLNMFQVWQALAHTLTRGCVHASFFLKMCRWADMSTPSHEGGCSFCLRPTCTRVLLFVRRGCWLVNARWPVNCMCVYNCMLFCTWIHKLPHVFGFCVKIEGELGYLRSIFQNI